MKLPTNMSEAQVLAAIDRIVNLLAPSFKFGYFDVEDIKQQGRIFAIEGIEDKYDENRPLENFLYTHVKNRLINFKRDKHSRNDPPCKSCHESIAGSTSHPDGQYCAKYEVWRKRNNSKKNILSPLDISNISDEKESRTCMESSVVEDVEKDELLRIIDMKLPVELRATYLQMRHGAVVPKPKRQEVEQAVLHILKGNVSWEISAEL